MKADLNTLLSVPPRVPDITNIGPNLIPPGQTPVRTASVPFRLPIALGLEADVVGQPWNSTPLAFDPADADGLVSGVREVYVGTRGFGRARRLLRRPRTAFVGGYLNTDVRDDLRALLDAGFDTDIAPLGAAVVLTDNSIAGVHYPLMAPHRAETAIAGTLPGDLNYQPASDSYGGDVLVVTVRRDQFACDGGITGPSNPYTYPGSMFDDGTDPDPPAPPAGCVQITHGRPAGVGNFYAYLDLDVTTAAAHRAALAAQVPNFARLRSVFFVPEDPTNGNFTFDEIWNPLVSADPLYELVRYDPLDPTAAAQAIYDLIVAHFS